MARRIWDFLSSGGQKTLAVEAPTGVGKSFALRVPALLWALEGALSRKAMRDPAGAVRSAVGQIFRQYPVAAPAAPAQ